MAKLGTCEEHMHLGGKHYKRTSCVKWRPSPQGEAMPRYDHSKCFGSGECLAEHPSPQGEAMPQRGSTGVSSQGNTSSVPDESRFNSDLPAKSAEEPVCQCGVGKSQHSYGTEGHAFCEWREEEPPAHPEGGEKALQCQGTANEVSFCNQHNMSRPHDVNGRTIGIFADEPAAPPATAGEQQLANQKFIKFFKADEPSSVPAGTAREFLKGWKGQTSSSNPEDWMVEFAEAFAAQKVREAVATYEEMLRAAHGARDGFESDVDQLKFEVAQLRQERDVARDTARERKSNLIHAAYVSLLKRGDIYEDKDWERADKWERHAINAALDLRNALAEVARLATTNITLRQSWECEVSLVAELRHELQKRDKCSFIGPMRDCPTHGESAELRKEREARERAESALREARETAKKRIKQLETSPGISLTEAGELQVWRWVVDHLAPKS